MLRKVIFFVIGLSFSVFAQAQSHVTGIVLDAEDEAPIEGAYISIDAINYNTLCDSLGRFEIRDIPAGNHEIFVEYLGYKAEKRRVRIPLSSRIVFKLEKKVECLSEVVVTATRTRRSLTNSPVLTSVVNAADIEASGVSTLQEAIELMIPGVNFSPDAHGDNLHIQGLGNDYILVLLDGQRLIGEMRGNVDFSRIAAANVKQIEVVKGASAVLYGSNAIGGVINIITKEGAKQTSGELEARYGTHDAFLLQLQGATSIKNTGINFSLFRRTHSGYDLTPESSPNFYTVNPYEDYSGELSITQKIGAKVKAKGNFRYYEHHLKAPSVSLVKESRLTRTYTGGIGIHAQLADKNSLEVQLHKDFAERFRLKDANDSRYKKGDYDYNSLQVIDKQDIGLKSSLLAGIEYSYEDVYSSNFSKEEGQNQSIENWHTFLQADCYITDNLEAVLGTRYTHNQRYGGQLTPSLSLLYKLNAFRIRANLAKGYRSPSLKEMHYNFDHDGFWIMGNPELKPEQSLYTSLSGEYSRKGVHVSLNFFRNKIEDKIHYYMKNTGERVEMHYRNYDETQVKGIELNSKISFLKDYNIQLGYAYTDAEDSSTGLQLKGNVKHSINCLLGWEYRKSKNPLTISLSGRASSGQIQEEIALRYNSDTQKHEKTLISNNQEWYTLWKINANKSITVSPNLNLMVFMGIDNITDFKDSFLLTSGRTYYGGIKLTINNSKK